MYSDTVIGSSNDSKAAQAGLQPHYRVSLTLAVSDASALWSAAVARLLGAPGMAFEDVVAVLGPCEDPAIGACLATLAKPDGVSGCLIDDFWIDAFPSMPPRLESVGLAGEGRADAGDRAARRLVTRRPAAPALHVLVNAAVPRTRLG